MSSCYLCKTLVCTSFCRAIYGSILDNPIYLIRKDLQICRQENRTLENYSSSVQPIRHLICNNFSRKVVLQNSDFFSGQPLFSNQKKIRVCRTTFLQPEKIWIYSINPPFFLVNHFSRTRKKSKFEEPFFSNQISRTTFLHLSRKVVAD